MKKTTITETIVFLYTVLFLYTGISKITDYSIFKEQIAVSPILVPISRSVAASLPWLEFLVVLLLVVPRWRLKGFYASLVLMILFTIYIIGMLAFDKNLPCSCGGVIELLSWKGHVIFNSVFMILSVIGIYLEKKIQKAKRLEYKTLFLNHPGFNYHK
jgi:uncharacterized membrane protein YphA (DoxX/SURF4 family)